MTNVVILTVYRTGPINHVFFDEMTLVFENMAMFSCPVIITGDVNIHLDDAGDYNARKLKELIQSFGFTQHVDIPTQRYGHTLDVVVSKSDLPAPIIEVTPPGEISDHSLILFQLPLPRPPLHYNINVATRAWRGFNEDEFRTDLLRSKLCSPAETHVGLTVDDLQDMYDNTLRQLLDKHAPSRSSRRRVSPLTPWFDAECSASKRKSRMLERRYRRTRSKMDRLEWLSQQRRKHPLYHAKQNSYWEAKITESRGNPKKLWKNLASLSKRERVESNPSDGLTAESFLNAFSDKVEGVRASTASAPPPSFDSPPGTSSFSRFRMVGESDIHRLISSAANKQCELDPVPTWLVKKYADELAPFITHLFNASLTTGQFPSSQKCAVVTPILKKPTLDPNDLLNYRPISNLTFLSKLLERTVHEQLMSYISENNLLPDEQSAYRIHRSTETAVLRVLSDAFAAADRGMVTLIGFLDLSAAFDTVDHRILLDRLYYSFGLKDTALRWMTSYLDGRFQFVRFCGSVSSTAHVSAGVPQGFVLGPANFIVYTAAVFRIIRDAGFNVMGYADDLQLYDHSGGGSYISGVENVNMHCRRCCMDGIQPSPAESHKNRTHPAGFATSTRECCAWNGRDRWGPDPVVATGPGSCSLPGRWLNSARSRW